MPNKSAGKSSRNASRRAVQGRVGAPADRTGRHAAVGRGPRAHVCSCSSRGGTRRARAVAIERVTQYLNPSDARVVALPKPTKRERGHWYYQRYIERLPPRGEIVLMDRSWYNRAGVERVMGYCTDEQYHPFLRQIPIVEQLLIEDGIMVIKYWFSVSDDEQQARFASRLDDPMRRWKLSPPTSSRSRGGKTTPARKTRCSTRLTRPMHRGGRWTATTSGRALQHDQPPGSAASRISTSLRRRSSSPIGRMPTITTVHRSSSCDTFPTSPLVWARSIRRLLEHPGEVEVAVDAGFTAVPRGHIGQSWRTRSPGPRSTLGRQARSMISTFIAIAVLLAGAILLLAVRRHAERDIAISARAARITGSMPVAPTDEPDAPPPSRRPRRWAAR